MIWGAGKIGRGFLAEIFNDAGYKLTFIEYFEDLVNKLKDRRDLYY
jgi:mannitol-1-phosphate/altronate dehydrogenase